MVASITAAEAHNAREVAASRWARPAEYPRVVGMCLCIGARMQSVRSQHAAVARLAEAAPRSTYLIVSQAIDAISPNA